jgi:hypothetical protein
MIPPVSLLLLCPRCIYGLCSNNQSRFSPSFGRLRLMSDQKPFTYQFIIERWADGLKLLGAGNGAGLLASGASLQFFAAKLELLFWIKVGAVFFLAGVLLFAFAFLILTILPLAIERFLASSDKTHRVFRDMITDLIATNKEDGVVYVILVATSLSSFVCFIIGCMFGAFNVVFELFKS